MGGRAASASLLRKRIEDPGGEPHEDEREADTIEDSDVKGVILVHKAVVQDILVWPHTHLSEDVDRLCPLAVAAEVSGFS